jgi:hypothetical protein
MAIEPPRDNPRRSLARALFDAALQVTGPTAVLGRIWGFTHPPAFERSLKSWSVEITAATNSLEKRIELLEQRLDARLVVSELALDLAFWLARVCPDGLEFDTEYSNVAAAFATFPASVIAEALAELEELDFVCVEGSIGSPIDFVTVLVPLLWAFDGPVLGLATEVDAREIAVLLLEDPEMSEISRLDTRLGWERRRLNPALSFALQFVDEDSQADELQPNYPTGFLALNAGDRMRLRRFVDATEQLPQPKTRGPAMTDQSSSGRARPSPLDNLTEAPDLDGLSDEEVVAAIEEWWHENFEDPVVEMPWADDRYHFIWGGPHDASDIVGDIFRGTISDDLIVAAVEAIEAGGIEEWAPQSHIHEPQEDDGHDDETLTPAELHATMLERAEAVEHAVAALTSTPPGIGHNRPPGPIEDAPLTSDELTEVSLAAFTLRRQEQNPRSLPYDVRPAVKKVEDLSARLAKWLAVSIASGAAGAAGGDGYSAASGAVGALWVRLAQALSELAEVAAAWLSSIG